MESEKLMKNREFVLSIFLFLLSFIVYYITLSPTLSSQSDSGELVTAVTLPGIAHPPGYPLYTVLGYLFSLLPCGDQAFRINLMSAIFSSFTVVLVFLIGRKIFHNIYVAIGTALLFAFSRDFWGLSLSAEVFSLHMCFVSLILYILFLWLERLSQKEYPRASVFLFGFVYGLSLSHHHTVLLLLPAILYLVISEKMYNKIEFWKSFFPVMFFFALGLLPYLYLPYAAGHDPPLNWGNPSSLQGFVRMVTRAGYGTFSLGSISGCSWSFHTFLCEAFHYIKALIAQFSPVFFLLGVFGMFIMVFYERRLFFFLMIILLLYGLCFIIIARFPYGKGFMALLERFYLPSYLAFVFYIGKALDHILGWLNKIGRSVCIAAFFMLVTVLAVVRFPDVDRHSNYLARDYGRNLLRSLDQRAILFVMGDVPVSSLLYCQYVEKKRQDVTIIVEGLLSSRWYLDQLSRRYPDILPLKNAYEKGGEGLIRDIIECQNLRRPVYFNHPSPDGSNRFIYGTRKRLICYGLAYKVTTEDECVGYNDCEALQALLDYEYEYNGKYDKKFDYFSGELIAMYSLAYYYLAKDWMSLGEKERALRSLYEAEKRSCYNGQLLFMIGLQYMEMELWNEAIRSLVMCMKNEGEKPEIYMNLAVIYSRQGETERAKSALRRMKELNRTSR